MSTKTSTFGVSRREGHDSSAFYRRFDTPGTDTDTTVNEIPVAGLDVIHFGDARHMTHLPDNSVALMITSPPYHVGKEYDTDDTFDQYLDLLYDSFSETCRVLQPGGRAAINIANLGRKPYIPLTSFVDAMCLDIGYLPRGQIIWQKAEGAAGNCAWGSFASAANPVLRDLHEYVLVYSKGQFGRLNKGVSTISREDFMAWTLSVWRIPPESAKRVHHPAPFPIELPRRLIELYSYEGDTILDPFIGSGSTAIAAVRSGRHYIGYENDAGYIQNANERIKEQTHV